MTSPSTPSVRSGRYDLAPPKAEPKSSVMLRTIGIINGSPCRLHPSISKFLLLDFDFPPLPNFRFPSSHNSRKILWFSIPICWGHPWQLVDRVLVHDFNYKWACRENTVDFGWRDGDRGNMLGRRLRFRGDHSLQCSSSIDGNCVSWNFVKEGGTAKEWCIFWRGGRWFWLWSHLGFCSQRCSGFLGSDLRCCLRRSRCCGLGVGWQRIYTIYIAVVREFWNACCLFCWRCRNIQMTRRAC